MKRCPNCEHRYGDEGWTCPSCSFAPPVSAGFPLFAEDLATSSEAFDEGEFDVLRSIEPISFWFRSRNRLIAWALERYVPSAGTLFEVGCGTGFVLAGLREANPGLRLSGSELGLSGLAYARERLPGVTLVQADARRLPFEEEFDVVCAFDVLEHIEDDQLVLSEMRRAAKPGGRVVVTVPQHRWLWSAADDYARHQRRYRKVELLNKMRNSGLTITRATSFVTLLLPLVALARLRSALGSTSYDIRKEHALPPALTRGLEGLMGLERAAIRAGLSPPVGSSLLVVSERPA